MSMLGCACTHLPRIFEVAEQDGNNLILEEYIEGDDLDFLLRESLFTPEETKKIVVQVCQALWVLHNMAAVHRDVKPENIVLRGGEEVLIDFDAARLHKPGHESDTQVLGTTEGGLVLSERPINLYGSTQDAARTTFTGTTAVIWYLLTALVFLSTAYTIMPLSLTEPPFLSRPASRVTEAR